MSPAAPVGRHHGRALELLRSCYSVDKFRLEDGSLTPRRWVYWWADPSAGWEGRHSFGSSNYDANGLEPREGADLSGQRRRWVCGSITCARAQCLSLTLTGGAGWSLTTPCPNLAGTMPSPTYVDLIIDLTSPDVRYTGTIMLQYIDPWRMANTSDATLLGSNGHLAAGNFVTLRFPNSITCSYNCTFSFPLVGYPGTTVGNRDQDLHQRGVPPLPWQIPSEPFTKVQRTITIQAAFHA